MTAMTALTAMTSLTTMSPHDSHDIITERWAQLSIQRALCCSSGHYGGRRLQIFRALRVSISSRILTDIPSQLVETIAEQGDNMQGFVTELILTLKAVVDTLDSNFRPMHIIKMIFKSTPNSKEVAASVTGVPLALPRALAPPA